MASVLNVAIVCILWTCITNCQAARNRHVVYWNSAMTPELKERDHVKHVKIGEFMDILCPQSSLMDITGRSGEPEVFNLFNVTESEYNDCQLKGRHRFLFACNRPERENKLTIKFQTISPSPLGFRFQYCADYYFMAVPRGRRTLHAGCTKDSTRIHIRVGCREEKTTTSSPTTTVTTTTTSTEKPTTVSKQMGMHSALDLVKRLREEQSRKIKDKQLVSKHRDEQFAIRPQLINPSLDFEPGFQNDDPRVLPSSDQRVSSDTEVKNSASRSRVSTVHLLLVVLYSTLLWQLCAIVTSS